MGCSWVAMVATTLSDCGVDHGDGRAVPEADVEPVARLVPGQAIGIGIGLERDQVAERARRRIEPGQRVPVDVGDPERLAVGGEGQARRAPCVPRIACGVGEGRLVREQAVRVVEAIDPIVEAAADVELLAVGRPDQAGERLAEG